MQFTRAVDYGIRALVLLGRQPPGSRHFLQELATQADLPPNYLVKVLKGLAKGGLVRSYRGIKGGFSLNRAPHEITLQQVVESIDGPVTVVHCLNDGTALASCPNSGRCAVQMVFAQLQDKVVADLKAHTIQELITAQAAIDKGSRGRPAPTS